MKRRKDNSDRASALQISLSIALLSGSAILLALAAPNNTKKPFRQVPATGQPSAITAPALFTAATPTPTPAPCNSAKIAFVSYGADGVSDVLIMNADGSNQTQVSTDGDVLGVSISGDGSKIAFTSNRDTVGGPTSEIDVMDVGGSKATRLTNNPGFYNMEPSFSRDGSKIAFASNRDDSQRAEVYVMNADGSNQTRLTHDPQDAREPSFSGDGSKIAFLSHRDGAGAIYVMNVDGSNQQPTNNPGAGDRNPSFSGDGSKIAFGSSRDGSSKIYVMNADGSNQTRLTNNPGGE